MSEKPLAGLKVLDLTRFFAGPFCAMHLGDHGADVVKVEAPGGDPTRLQGPPFLAGNGMTYLAANRNKRSIVVDTRTAEGRTLLRQLAERADVVVENFRPSVLGRLGIGYAAVSAVNPGVIYASLSALGADGPQAEKGGFDITAQAEFGFMSITGEKGGASIKQGTSVFDLVSGLYQAAEIVAEPERFPFVAVLAARPCAFGFEMRVCALRFLVVTLPAAGAVWRGCWRPL